MKSMNKRHLEDISKALQLFLFCYIVFESFDLFFKSWENNDITHVHL